MSFQVLSDIHLEFYNKYPGFNHFIKSSENCEYLFLAGDIGDPFSSHYKTFLQECSEKSYKYIFIIAGNHEYYFHHVHKVQHHIRKICKISPKLIFLENESFSLDDFIVIGTTLWTHIQNIETTREISDFTKIKNWTIERNNNANRKALNYLKKNIYPCKKYIIITHHCPVKFQDHEAFYNDYEDFIRDHPNIVVWIYGHDHSSTNIKIKNTRIISNQFGYPGEKTGYVQLPPLIIL